MAVQPYAGPGVVDDAERITMPIGEIDEVIDRAEELEAEFEDLVCVAVRGLTDSGNRTSLDDVLASFGYTREQLAAIPDED